VDELKTTISKFEKHLDNFYQFRSDLKLYYGGHMSEEMLKKIDQTFKSLNLKISTGKERLSRLKKSLLAETEEANRKAETTRVEQEKSAEKQRIQDLLKCGESLLAELNTRHSILLGNVQSIFQC
jgi:septal ring factor EnvC (AmiA/AmiB activator)